MAAAGIARPQAKAAAEPAEQRARHVTMLAQQLMLQRYAPACVLINRKAEVLYLHGPVDQYLQLPVGEFGADLIAIAREGLRTRLRSAVHQAIRHDRRVQVGGVRVKRGRKYATVGLTVEPLQQPREAEHLLLVSFDEQDDEHPVRVGAGEPFQAVPPDVPEAAADYEAIVRQLEDELRTTREDLQSTIEELETSNEEFKAANEEVMSINEELQSANEELETSKEELQSLNEELQTVNNQLEQKLAELEATNNDLSNLLASTDVATIFLDRQFCLRRFTPATTRILRVLDTDVGRPISDLAQTFTDVDLIPDAERVLQFLGAIEKETQHVDGHWYVRRIVPYRTEDNRIEGVVVTFRDITRQKADERSLQAATEQLEQRVADRTAELESSNVALRESEHRFRTLLESAPDAVVVVDDRGHITQINRRAEELFGYSEQEATGLHVNALAPPDRADEFAHLLAPLRRGDLVRDFETVRLHKDGTPIDVALTVSSVAGNGFCSIIHDIRERKRLEQQLAELTDQERQRLGRELHDSLGQQISALGILVAALQEQLPSDVPGANVVVKLESALDQAKQQVRALVKGLFPVSVDAAGLRVALQELTEEISRSYQIACRFECPHEVSLRDNFVATQLFLIAREAALNAARHSRAAEMVIRLTDHDGIRVAVEDNGVGLPANVDPIAGDGLAHHASPLRAHPRNVSGAVLQGRRDGGRVRVTGGRKITRQSVGCLLRAAHLRLVEPRPIGERGARLAPATRSPMGRG